MCLSNTQATCASVVLWNLNYVASHQISSNFDNLCQEYHTHTTFADQVINKTQMCLKAHLLVKQIKHSVEGNCCFVKLSKTIVH